MSIDPLRQMCVEHGAFLRRDALALGLTDAELSRSLRAGVLVRVRHGAYTFTDLWKALDQAQRHLVLSRAVMRVHAGGVALSHHSAVLLHGIDLWNADLRQVHVTRTDRGAGRATADTVHHQGLILPEDTVQMQGLPVVTAVRAALESASLMDVERGLVVVDSGLRQGLYDSDDVRRQFALMTSWPGSLRLQLVTRLADGRSESVGETRARHLFWVAGIPAPELQFRVMDGQALLGIADFAWPEYGLLGEFDGKVKYTRYLRPGESPGDAVFREKQREDRMRALGWRFVRLTWPMLAQANETVAHVRRALRAAA